MKKFNLFLSTVLMISLMLSCGDDNKDDVDSSKPKITIQTPSENDEYAIGDTIYLTAIFSDNNELKNCVVSLSLIQGSGAENPWTPSSMTIPLSGTSQSVNNTILFGESIPVCQAGTYKVTIEVSDNSTTPNITIKEIIIEIYTTTTKPGITIQTPSENNEYAIGETILLTATFTDNKELKNCEVSLSLVQGSGDGDPWTPSSITIPLSGTSQSVDNTTLFGGPIPICQAGTYKIKFEVRDNANTPNITIKEVNIKITSTSPVLTVTKPTEGSEYNANDTEPLLLSAICTDNKELKELTYNVTYIDNGKNILKRTNGVNDPWYPDEAKIIDEFTGKNSVTLDNYILYGTYIPKALAGSYRLTLTLTDTDGNATVKKINFVLK